MKEIIVNSSISINSIAYVGICVFACMFIFFFLQEKRTKEELKKIKRAKELIEYGHEKALNGRKNDGFYKETKVERASVNTETVTLGEDENE